MMTADQIERRVERMMDHLDRRLMAGEMTQKNYDLAVADLRTWEDAKWAAYERDRAAGRITGGPYNEKLA